MSETQPRRRTERWVFYVAVGQFLAGALSIVVGINAPGLLVGAVLTGLLGLALKKDWVVVRTAWVGALVCAALGFLYPWPWIQYEEQSVQRTATVRTLVGPPDCVCLALTVPPLWEGDPSSGQAEAFCVPKTDERMLPLLASGTVSSSWSITLQKPIWTDPTLDSVSLQTVEEVDAQTLYANNGCRQAL